ncbi:MAG: MlaD family protein [Cyanobacteria bacterium]|jgi:phospholipid/cholesterol/gamma-HCH transport system substrate-binding protein|nr:MlaD family protein [Cyanobacteriota bacterium]
MRRSVREALVGFSLLAAIASAVGLSFWLRGLSISRQHWTVEARFTQADGLAVRSPVVYRGVIVGTVRTMQITQEAVVAQLEITNANLRLAQPTVAEIGQLSLLGGESQVALLSSGPPLPADAPSPRAKDCDRQRMLCDGASIRGSEGASLSSLTTLMYQMLAQVEQDQLVEKVAGLTTSIDQTAKEATAFLAEGRGLVKDGKSLFTNLDASVDQIQPTLTNLNAGSAQLRELIAALDNPKMLGDLQQTMSNAERLTAQWGAVGGDVHQLTADPRFMDGLRSVAVGLGQFFEELYPAQTGATQPQVLPDSKTPPAAEPR